MISNVILSAPGFVPSPLTLVNKTATTITVSWILVPSDVDRFVGDASSDTHTVTQQVKGSSQNDMTLNSSHGNPCHLHVQLGTLISLL